MIQEGMLKRKGVSRNGIQIFLMLFPMLVLFVLFCLYPLIHLIYLSFTRYNGFTSPVFVGLENFSRLIKDTTWWKVVLNTFQFTLMAYVIQIPLSLLLAILVNGKIKGKNFFRTIIFLPNITSTAIIGVIFFFMFSSHNGIINGILINLGLIKRPIEWL